MGGICSANSTQQQDRVPLGIQSKATQDFLQNNKLTRGADQHQYAKTMPDEQADYFDRNSKFFKIKQENLLHRVDLLANLLELSVHAKVDPSYFIDKLLSLRKKVSKLNPHQESFNDMTKAMDDDGTDILGDKNPGQDITGLTQRVNLLQQEWELQVVQYEQELFNACILDQGTAVKAEIERYQNLEYSDESIKDGVEKTSSLLHSKDATIQQNIEGISQFRKLHGQMSPKLFEELMNHCQELAKTYFQQLSQISSIEEIINERMDQLEAISKQIDMALMSQPKIGSSIQALITQIKEVSCASFDRLAIIRDQKITKYKQQLQAQITQDSLTYEQGMTIINQSIEQNDFQSQEIQLIFSNVFSEIITSLAIIKVEISRSNLEEVVDFLMELNQQATTDAAHLGMNTEQGIANENAIIQVRDYYEQIEEEKGFLDENDEEDIAQQLKDIAIQVIQLEKETVSKSIEMQSSGHDQDIESVGCQFRAYCRQTNQLATALVGLQELFDGLIRSLQENYSTNKALEAKVYSVYQKMQGLRRTSKEYNPNRLKAIFKEQLTTQTDQIDQAAEGLRTLLNEMQDIQTLVATITSLEEQIKDLSKEVHASAPQGSKLSQGQVIIVSEGQLDKVDQLLIKLMKSEQERLQQEQKTKVKYPILFKQGASSETEKVQTSIYSTRSSVSEEGYDLFKVKVGQDVDLSIKMESGAYLLADRLGLYYNQLLLEDRFGFNLQKIAK